ncbi:DNA-directed DNA polymerase [Leptospira interrogans serovar Canicola]|nr:DNA-directed DNA polymerase [Leptospira interrogans serovar Canicola]
MYFHIVENQEEKRVIRAHDTYSIQPINELFLRLADLLGDRSVFYSVGEQLKVINKSQAAG